MSNQLDPMYLKGLNDGRAIGDAIIDLLLGNNERQQRAIDAQREIQKRAVTAIRELRNEARVNHRVKIEDDDWWVSRERVLCDYINNIPRWIRWFFSGGAQ